MLKSTSINICPNLLDRKDNMFDPYYSRRRWASELLNPCVGSTLNSCTPSSLERVNHGDDFVVVSDMLATLSVEMDITRLNLLQCLLKALHVPYVLHSDLNINPSEIDALLRKYVIFFHLNNIRENSVPYKHTR